jgi:hypothetical protein
MIKMNDDGALVVSVIEGGEAVVAEIEAGTAYEGAEVTTMETKGEKSKGGHDNNYPFLTKAQIADRIGSDAGFVQQAIGILYANQTADEREEKDTKYKNRAGFMSSHAVTGSKLAEKLLSGAGWTQEESEKARAIASRYTRQLALHFREEKLAESPELAAKVACFFTPQPTKQG